jgi:methylglutaconyl-CoA hydratase
VLRAIGAREARRWFLTGERFGASEARRIGLVHEVVPGPELGAACDRMIAALLTSGPEAVGVAKRLIEEVTGKNPDEAMPVTVRTIAERRASAEAKEGLTAFLEKRLPAWAPKKPAR